MSTTRATSVDALIIGAGPAGSATAAFLADAGVSVMVVDRARFPRHKACSEYMSPAAVRILDRLGALEALEAAGAFPVAGTTVVAAKGSRLTGRFGEVGRPFRSTGLSVERSILDAELVAAARRRGAVVAEGTRLVRVLEDRDGLRGAVVQGPEGPARVVQARVTIGADGLNSRVARARAFGPRTRGPLRRLALVAHMSGVAAMEDRAELHLAGGGYAGLNPIGAGLTNVAMVLSHGGSVRHRHEGDLEPFFRRCLASFPGMGRRLEGARLERSILAAGPFDVRSRRVAVPGGLLVGDAADFFDPFTGEGIHSALRGAELATDAIVGAMGELGPSADTLPMLHDYLRARRRAFWGKWIVERMIGYGMLAPHIFDHAVSRIGKRPPMAHTMIGVTGHVVPPTAVLNPIYLARMVI